MRVVLAAFGMGNYETRTIEAQRAIDRADVIIGAGRLLKELEISQTKTYIPLSLPHEIAEAIRSNPDWGYVVVAISGDVGFYSAAAKLLQLLADKHPKIICGVSSPVYFAAKLGKPWQNWHLVSAHAGECEILHEVLNHPSVFFLTGSTQTPQSICKILCEAGLGKALVTIGENLGSENERLSSKTAQELTHESFSPLSVMLVENAQSFNRKAVSPGIRDEKFLRGQAPMTKRDVRVSALARLEICADDILWDVGAGTGSVSIEMALLARHGEVHTVECNSDACYLILQNKVKFGTYNLFIHEGKAPAALSDLPAPDAVFIGGSKGNMGAIIDLAKVKNPEVRLVIAAITLETLSEATTLLKERGYANFEVAQISVSRSERLGSYRMLKPQNPVFLISAGGENA